MDAKEFASHMKAEIEEMKNKGVAAVYVDNLINYLSNVESIPSEEPSAAQLEHYKGTLNVHLEAMKHNNNMQIEMFKSALVAGQNAIRTMIVINGGAAVAMLAFISNLLRDGRTFDVAGYAAAMLAFTAGALLAGLVSGGTYLTQWIGASDSQVAYRVAFGINLVTILLGIVSFVAFGIGAWKAYSAFPGA
ncbi:hypothetical protein HJA90_10570 [Rhizobium bangladeshense]|uniref:hypothetical protein n=1 Tax=Rhizobium bangladeshense TaxID=1138189 RepID=UPI001C82AA88|nr:hypothetical protein [Rhizobium bangladeshense]MBX4884026.1 hypothetical protein [Rhizobium bangladeshense]